MSDNTESKIISLLREIIKLKKDLKSTTSAYRDQIKELENEVTELVEKHDAKQKK